MKRIVALISGRGSNLRAIVEACERERWSASIVAVISDRPHAGGCEWARSQGLRVEVLPRSQFPDRAAFDRALSDCIVACQPDVVVLAGFMRILDPALVERFAGRILNIHPSLLPAFPGLHTHRRALEAGVRLHGATVHYVVAELDAGPIIAQAALAVRDDEDESALAARVLALEHRLYPMALRWHLEGRLRCEGQRVLLDRATADEGQAWLP
jgi:phosphoribosylglycinamide formyltransferase-1